MDSALVLPRPVILRPQIWLPTPAAETLLDYATEKKYRKLLGDLLRTPKDYVLMAGSKANYLSKKVADLILGGTAYSAPGTLYCGLWTSAISDTLVGNSAGEAGYTSYARLALTNNTTIFAAGTGTTTYVKTFPSDGAKSFPSCTGGSSTVTYMGILDGNTMTSSDNGYLWCSVTSVSVTTGVTPVLAVNSVSLTED